MRTGIDARAAKWYRGTGIGTYTYQLINSINKVDIENNYLLFTPENFNMNYKLNDNFKTKNIKENKENCFWEEVNIPNLLMGENIELYHVPQNGVGLPKNKTCPFIITLHDVIPLKMPETVSERYLEIFNDELPKIIPLCDGIITVSNYSKEDISKAFNFPKEKIFVTYLAAEDIYKPLDKLFCKNLIKAKYLIEDNYILYIGGFSPRKNIIGLIEAFSILPEELLKSRKLVIAGNKGISYEIYKKRAETLHIQDKVIFTGFIPMEDIPHLYNAAELFVYPSFYEGFGLPPLEAMACGIPVIASNATSIPEILEDSCILIDPYNAYQLRDSIVKVISDLSLQQSLIQKGFLKSQCYNWDTTAINTIEAYKKVIK
ncbi:MAG: glycosyltransferase family 4 protein [Clostridiaceae bacterium]|nr:glycosyltransferase family 4 protein [Clostridiaceae bacterium]